MTETIHINWLLLVGPFVWILGCAVFVALMGTMHYSKVSAGLRYLDFIKKPGSRTAVLIGTGLIICGFLLYYARIPSDQLVVVEIDKQKLPPLKSISSQDSIRFTPGELKMDSHNRNHILNNEKMKDNTMVLLWDGYIQTPFLEFKQGEYIMEFQAKGTIAGEEFSKLKIEFEIPDQNNYMCTIASTYIELTGKMKVYRMNFQVPVNAIGRIRLTYFNDVYLPETGTGRDVWVRELMVSSDRSNY